MAGSGISFTKNDQIESQILFALLCLFFPGSNRIFHPLFLFWLPLTEKFVYLGIKMGCLKGWETPPRIFTHWKTQANRISVGMCVCICRAWGMGLPVQVISSLERFLNLSKASDKILFVPFDIPSLSVLKCPFSLQILFKLHL